MLGEVDKLVGDVRKRQVKAHRVHHRYGQPGLRVIGPGAKLTRDVGIIAQAQDLHVGPDLVAPVAEINATQYRVVIGKIQAQKALDQPQVFFIAGGFCAGQWLATNPVLGEDSRQVAFQFRNPVKAQVFQLTLPARQDQGRLQVVFQKAPVQQADIQETFVTQGLAALEVFQVAGIQARGMWFFIQGGLFFPTEFLNQKQVLLMHQASRR